MFHSCRFTKLTNYMGCILWNRYVGSACGWMPLGLQWMLIELFCSFKLILAPEDIYTIPTCLDHHACIGTTTKCLKYSVDRSICVLMTLVNPFNQKGVQLGGSYEVMRIFMRWSINILLICSQSEFMNLIIHKL